MEFYSGFSKNYDKIFPLKENKLKLLDQTFSYLKNDKKQTKLLDVGCGTGSYAVALAGKGYQVIGIDLDSEMIALAKNKQAGLSQTEAEDRLDFFVLGMLELKDKFSQDTFDGIYIIGNVLVHLNKSEIKEFIHILRKLIKKEGKIVIQIVNYQRILDLELKGLPTIYSKDEKLRFERDYEYDPADNNIYFKTTLVEQEDNNILAKNKIKLYPLTKDELIDLLEAAAFEIENIYGSATGDSYQELESLPLILTAVK
ncbi:class I SAM-dependent methyltransferase [Halanaerobium hydrogeniformans]|uniref:Methyltransferase type 11 n=1 Tax=Halanaerobium hydrogeniformans TaxID=656519 RepID=E4RMJ4_HALHG|nr:class I SAM-dependent methyltransferase [Halanaerobium hydrogeniformans]ADQ14525.1 Methyltransferase type 11 [Halanaerobium hydrogeniformans]